MITKDYFSNRRTIRQYTNRKINQQLLNDLLMAASQAPTTGNMQLYSVVITEDEEMKKRLAPTHFNQPSVMSAAAVLTFCADFNRFVKWCEARNAKPGYDNFQAWVWAVEDTMIFAQQFVTLAEMHGLGTCYLGTTTYNAPQISEILELPDRVVPIATVTVGYPAVEGQLSDRLPIEAIVHHEKYVDYDSERINQIYAEKEALPESDKFIKENGKETLAQVFTDVRYKQADNEYFSKVFADFIREKGFEI
ncbi:MAG: nitroreductase family protein [Muribaculaceae bacterium]|nr:nitroreductase family protein [Muribaculaceae bacterium]